MKKEAALKLETVLERLLNGKVEKFNPPENFDRVKIDIYPNDYGINCHITFLMKKPFSQKDSDFFSNFQFSFRSFIKSVVGDIFSAGIQQGQSTIESYENTNWWYLDKKSEFE